MVQRTKVLDTEGTNAKFLFSMIKQLDLKSIDWNKVAQDLEISNGHAARMRYSRFRLQMDGPSRASRVTKKKNPKKAGIKSNAQIPFPHGHTGFTPKLEPSARAPQKIPWIKCENGGPMIANTERIPDASESFHFSPMMAPPGMAYPIVPSYAHQGMPFPMGTGMISAGYPLSGSNFAPLNDSPMSSFLQHDIVSNPDRCMSHLALNSSPTIDWEDQPPVQPGKHLSDSSHMKLEGQADQNDLQGELLPDMSVKREASVQESTSPGA